MLQKKGILTERIRTAGFLSIIVMLPPLRQKITERREVVIDLQKEMAVMMAPGPGDVVTGIIQRDGIRTESPIITSQSTGKMTLGRI